MSSSPLSPEPTLALVALYASVASFYLGADVLPNFLQMIFSIHQPRDSFLLFTSATCFLHAFHHYVGQSFPTAYFCLIVCHLSSLFLLPQLFSLCKLLLFHYFLASRVLGWYSALSPGLPPLPDVGFQFHQFGSMVREFHLLDCCHPPHMLMPLFISHENSIQLFLSI